MNASGCITASSYFCFWAFICLYIKGVECLSFLRTAPGDQPSALDTRTRVQRNLKPVSWNPYGHKKDAPLGTYMFSFQVGL